MRLPALALLILPIALSAATDLGPVRTDLAQGRADDAVTSLKQAIAVSDKNADAFNLYCRVSMQLERWDDAVSECERAVSLASDSSNNHLWLGRAYGSKAERASMFSAYSFARKLKTEFETAVSLDPKNAEAMADLGEFYCSAPSVVGGGTSKAEELLGKLSAIDPVRGHELHAQIYAAQKNNSAAESELKAAISAAAHPANQWMSLASFYRKAGRLDEMVQAVKSGSKADPSHTSAQVNGASTLVRSQREIPAAIQMLRDYLSSNHKSEDAPAFAVHVQLGNILAKQGDAPGAQREYQAALALAHDYKPAINAANGSH
jgi:tetratricopeptide (TPR) repeat protein